LLDKVRTARTAKLSITRPVDPNKEFCMKTHARLLLVAAVTLGLGGWFLGAGSGRAADEGGDGWQQIIPEEETTRLIQEDADYVKEKLAKHDARDAKRARMAAIMIAAYAASARGDANKLAGVRDMALKVAQDAKDKKYDAAMKAVNNLKALRGNGGGKADFPKELDVEDIMRPFALPNTGGLGIEKELLGLGRRPLGTAALNQKSQQLTLFGYRAAVIAELAKRNPSETAQKNAANRKKWDGWADDMSKAAVQFAEAARSKNAQTLKTAAVKLNNSCSQCHEVFRAEE
jgi:cytochrome c556